MADEQGKVRISAGSVALILACVGWALRLAVVSSNSGRRGGLERVSDSAIGLGSISAVLVLVGGLLGIYAAVKDDGREVGVIAVVLAALLAAVVLAAVR